MSRVRIVAAGCAAVIIAGLLATAIGLGFTSVRPAAAESARPAVTVVPVERRLRRVSARARDTVRELDGKARVHVLREMITAAREAGMLRRWALELQSVSDDHKKRRNGDYLHRLYLALKRASARRSLVFASELAREGVAIGPSAGHFQYLSHLDPTAPLPAAPINADAAAAPMDRWVDAFVRADYDLGYRPNRRGALSETLQLTYADGVTLDIDIRVIADSYDPAPTHAMAYAYVGPGARVFPLRLGRSTTPRLWRAKHTVALAAMHRSNQDYETFASIAVAGTMTNLPLGLVVPVHPPPTPRVTARTAPRAGARAPAATRPAAMRPRGNTAAPRSSASPVATSTAARAGPILRPGGRLIGQPGSNSRIRVVRGGQAEAEALFVRLAEGGDPMAGTTYPGRLVRFPDGGKIGLRPSSTSGPPTIDVIVNGIRIEKIKFRP